MNLVRNALFKEFDFLIQQYGMLLGFFFFFKYFLLFGLIQRFCIFMLELCLLGFMILILLLNSYFNFNSIF